MRYGRKAGRQLGRRARWAVPAGAVLAVGAVVAGTAVAAGAQAAPSLPARTAAQLLADAQHAAGPGPMTATIAETANLGLPALPGSSNSSSALSLLSGSHTFNIWYADPTHVRVAEPVQLGETDFRRDGSQVWLWSSKTQTATHLVLPAFPAGWHPGRQHPAGQHPAGSHPASRHPAGSHPASRHPAGQHSRDMHPGDMLRAGLHRPVLHRPGLGQGLGLGATGTPPTPQQVARQILAAVGPTTTVSVQRNITIAGQAAYQLAIAPKDSRSLIGQVRIAIDASKYLPLRVQVFARGATTPAFQIGFTALSFGRPAASNFTFTPPPGAKVKTVKVPARFGRPGHGPAGWYGSPQSGASASPAPSATQHVTKNRATGGHQATDASQLTATLPRGSLYSKPGSRLSSSQSAAVSVHSASGPHARVMGKGWLSVLVLGQPAPGAAKITSASGATVVTVSPSSGALTSSRSLGPGAGFVAPDSSPGGAGILRALLRAATPVHGAWGSGQLLRTSLVSILVTKQGTILIGAVAPSVLYSDAAAITSAAAAK
jgi:hypothetical protein